MPIQLPQSLEIKPQGDADDYFMLMDAPSHWSASIRLNGEWLPEKQQAFAARLAGAYNSHEHMVEVARWVARSFAGGARDIPAHIAADAATALELAGKAV